MVRGPHAPRPKRQEPRKPRKPRNEARAYRRLSQIEPLIEKDPRSAHALVPKGAADHGRGCAEGARQSRIHLPRLLSNAVTTLRLLMRPLEPAARDPSPMRHLEPAARDASPMRPLLPETRDSSPARISTGPPHPIAKQKEAAARSRPKHPALFRTRKERF
jgi:hypothetical protein